MTPRAAGLGCGLLLFFLLVFGLGVFLLAWTPVAESRVSSDPPPIAILALSIAVACLLPRAFAAGFGPRAGWWSLPAASLLPLAVGGAWLSIRGHYPVPAAAPLLRLALFVAALSSACLAARPVASLAARYPLRVGRMLQVQLLGLTLLAASAWLVAPDSRGLFGAPFSALIPGLLLLGVAAGADSPPGQGTHRRGLVALFVVASGLLASLMYWVAPVVRLCSWVSEDSPVPWRDVTKLAPPWGVLLLPWIPLVVSGFLHRRLLPHLSGPAAGLLVAFAPALAGSIFAGRELSGGLSALRHLASDQ